MNIKEIVGKEFDLDMTDWSFINFEEGVVAFHMENIEMINEKFYDKHSAIIGDICYDGDFVIVDTELRRVNGMWDIVTYFKKYGT